MQYRFAVLRLYLVDGYPRQEGQAQPLGLRVLLQLMQRGNGHSIWMPYEKARANVASPNGMINWCEQLSNSVLCTKFPRPSPPQTSRKRLHHYGRSWNTPNPMYWRAPCSHNQDLLILGILYLFLVGTHCLPQLGDAQPPATAKVRRPTFRNREPSTRRIDELSRGTQSILFHIDPSPFLPPPRALFFDVIPTTRLAIISRLPRATVQGNLLWCRPARSTIATERNAYFLKMRLSGTNQRFFNCKSRIFSAPIYYYCSYTLIQFTQYFIFCSNW